MKNIGKTIYGFCNGYFGRDDYDTKIIVFETDKSICCRNISDDKWNKNNWLTVANFDSEEEKQNCIDRWSKEE